MKNTAIGIAFVAVLIGTPALAADMAVKAPPPPAPVWSWTGFYIGGNAGGVWGNSDPAMSVPITNAGYFNILNTPIVDSVGIMHIHPGAATAGGEIGYNLQTNNIVWGIEADFNYLGLNASSSAVGTYVIPARTTFNLTQSVQTDWLFTLRPRVGFAVDSTLIYVTAGLALTDLKYNAAFSDVFGATNIGAISTTRAGWTVGGGIEHALGLHWSAKAEYLYADFGSVSTTGVGNATFNNTPGFPGSLSPFTDTANLKVSIVRVGLNYKLGGP
jgi:outer membrane immunogenic protein